LASRSLSFFLPDLSGGGAERAMIDLAYACRQAGDSVELVVARPGGSASETVPDGVSVKVLGAGRTAAATPALAGYLRHQRPYGLVSALTHANLVAVAAASAAHSHTRIVVAEHANVEYVLDRLPQLKAALYRRTIRMLYRRATAIVAVSNGTADSLAAATGLPRSRIRVVPNIVQVDRIRRAAATGSSSTHAGNGDVPTLVALGRLEPVKGFDVLLHAFRRVRAQTSSRLVIAGEGPLRAHLESLTRELRLEHDVVLPGFVPDPYPLLAQAAAVVLSSRSEALPTVILEAFALGIPVVATDCPTGPRELLGESIGRLVPVDDPVAMGDALLAALREEVPVAPPSALERYRSEHVAEIYRSLVGAGPRRRQWTAALNTQPSKR
jgi:glycosyltransferase involved in cell wall biosynthesis